MIKFVVVQDGKPIEPKNPSGGKGKEKDVRYKGQEWLHGTEGVEGVEGVEGIKWFTRSSNV